MKFYKTLLITALSLSLSALGYAQDGYLVILKSFTTPTLKQGQTIEKQFNQLKEQGFSPYIIKTDDYPPLRKGLWAIVLGEFDKQTAAEKQTQVKTWVSDAYLRKVQLPKARAIDEQFSAVDTYFKRGKDCFSVDQDLEQSNYGRDFCIGKQGYDVSMAYIDSRAYLNINGEEFQGGNWMGSADFPLVSSEYPLTWIYRTDNLRQPIAVSLVISTADFDGNNHNDRYFIKINGKDFTIVKQKFPIKGGLDNLAEYLLNNGKTFDQDGLGEKIDKKNTNSEGKISQSLQTCLDNIQASDWDVTADENSCHTKEYLKQLPNIHKKIRYTYQRLLDFNKIKDKQATVAIEEMDKAWQQYRDNKCQLFQALSIPFRRTEQTRCELETTKNYLAEQKALLQAIQASLAANISFSDND